MTMNLKLWNIEQGSDGKKTGRLFGGDMPVKRSGIVILATVLVLFCITFLGGCNRGYSDSEPIENDQTESGQEEFERTDWGHADAGSEDGKIHILCTTFPIYDWTKQITMGQEEYYDVRLLMDQGTDLHNYQPTVEDIILMSEADLLISIGGESDRWMEDVIDSIPEEKRDSEQYLELMDVLGTSLREEEYVEGMERSREEDSTHQEGIYEETDYPEETEYDEHIWLSVKNAELCVSAIGDAIRDMALNEDALQAVAENTALYLEELNELDQEYTDVLEQADDRVLLFGGRFPFLYMVKDYGLEYYAAFQGCSAETGASFETIVFLAEKVDEYGLPAVLVIENEDARIAATIIANTAAKDQVILSLDSMQSVTEKDIEQGTDYISIMRENLSVLKAALGIS